MARMLQQATVDERPDLLGDEIGLGVLVVGLEETGGRASRVIGDQAGTVGQQIAQCVGELDQVPRSAVAVIQRDQLAVWMPLAKAQQTATVGASPTEQRLDWAPNAGQIAVLCG